MLDLSSWIAIDRPRRAAAFLVAVGLNCALIVGLVFGPVWRLYAWIPDSALRTDRLRITHDLASKWQDATPDVLVLGGSQLREALPVDEFIAKSLSTACHRDLQVLNAASSSQLIETSRAIGDWFVGDTPELVVLSVNVWRAADEFTSPQSRARAAFSLQGSERLPADQRDGSIDLATLSRARLGITFMDAANALGIGVPNARPTDGPFLGAQHQYRTVAGDPQRQIFDAHYQSLLADQLPASALANELQEYRALALHLMSRGSRVAYFIAPESPRIRPLLAPHEDAVVAALNSLPGASPLTLLDLRHANETSESDFADFTHLLESGRHAIWPRVLDWLVDLQGCERVPAQT